MTCTRGNSVRLLFILVNCIFEGESEEQTFRKVKNDNFRVQEEYAEIDF